MSFGPPEKTPWAVLLVKFQDDLVERWPREHYERLFTAAGAGSMNMLDYFSEMSHGRLDLSGSQVFGWFTLPVDKSEYDPTGENPEKLDRRELVALCRKTAVDQGVDLSGFAKELFSLNADYTEFYGEFGIAVCDSTSLWPSVLGHEMGHGYGLDHSRRDESAEDYEDHWDVMSALRTVMVPHPEYQFIGPGLNAADMRGHGWLDEGKVWRFDEPEFDYTIDLRPLHRPDLGGGYVAASWGSS